MLSKQKCFKFDALKTSARLKSLTLIVNFDDEKPSSLALIVKNICELYREMNINGLFIVYRHGNRL